MAAVSDESSLRAEIERLIQRHRHLLAAAHRAPSTWRLEKRCLCWHIVLGDVLEPDIDIEQLQDALVIRARTGGEVYEALIPVPDRFRETAPRYVFHAQVLEIRFTP